MANDHHDSHAADLPAGWVWTTLGQVANVQSGAGFPKTFQGKTEGDLPFAKVSDISTAVLGNDGVLVRASNYVSFNEAQKLHAKILPAGTTVFAKIGEAVRLNRRAFVKTPLVVDNNVMGLIPNGETISDRFVYYFMHTVDLYEYSQATTVPSVRKSDVEQIRFPLAPLPEQHRIVAKIEEHFTRLDAGVAALKRALANLKRYKAAVLKAACEGKLVAQDAAANAYDEPASELLKRILAERRAKWAADLRAKGKDPQTAKYEEPQAPDIDELPELPESWTWVTVGQLAWSVKDGPHYSPTYADDGIPFITGGNVRPNGVDFANAKHISPELHAELIKRCKPEKGDILYTKGGTTGIARVNNYDQEFSVWVHVAVLKLSDSIEPFYLQHALNSEFCYKQAQKYTHGVGNQDLGLTRMVKIVLALPPLAEQRRIVADVERRLSVVQELDATLTANLARAERLRQSILKRAFEGKL